MGKVLFFTFLSSQIFLKELLKKEDETANVNSTQIVVLVNNPLSL